MAVWLSYVHYSIKTVPKKEYSATLRLPPALMQIGCQGLQRGHCLHAKISRRSSNSTLSPAFSSFFSWQRCQRCSYDRAQATADSSSKTSVTPWSPSQCCCLGPLVVPQVLGWPLGCSWGPDASSA